MPENHKQELKEILVSHGMSASVGGEYSRTMGDVAAAFIAGSSQASILVLQAAQGRSTAA